MLYSFLKYFTISLHIIESTCGKVVTFAGRGRFVLAILTPENIDILFFIVLVNEVDAHVRVALAEH